MPYIKNECDLRDRLIIGDIRPVTAGELNFLITAKVKAFLAGSPNYDAFNEVIGVLECAKLELYRRMVAPYEDTKKEQNGDVYE